MTRPITAAPAVSLLLSLGKSTVLVAPVPAFSFAQENTYELAAADKTGSKLETTKAWLKAKKTQTTRWMGRQKQRLKRVAD